MCGIAGLFHMREGAAVDETLLGRMTDVQAHRGPDGSGFHVGEGVGLGHRRLSIIDLGGGHQPMISQDGRYAITFNGEIYNFPGLRIELQSKGHVFKTNCDTEVLLHAYMEWGADCLSHIGGMFAFAIWDAREKTLFLARDRVGKKPLYYTVLPNGWLLFASEMKGLLTCPDLPRRISAPAVESYLALGYVPDHQCILEGVHKLPAGASIHLQRGAELPKPQIYWDMDFTAGQHAVPEKELPGQLREEMRAAVGQRMISDVPLGAFLSGGVDSSAVVATMAELSDAPVKTCSIGFDVAAFDETVHAQKVANHIGTEHRMQRVAQDDLHMLDKMAAIFDEPFADNSCLPTFEVCRLAREQVTVALSGDGGDEVFAGYRRYRFHMAEERMRSMLPYGLRKPLFGALGALYPKLDWAPQALRAKSTFQSLARSTAEAYFQTVSIMSGRERALLRTDQLQSELQGEDPEEHFRQIVADAPAHDPLSQIQYLDFKTWLVGDILTKVDRTSMANSLEVRVPMLDYEFLSWAAKVAPSARLKGGEGKWILKKAYEDALPNDILYRKKMGFSSPLDAWFRGALKPTAQSLSQSQALLDTQFISREGVEQLVREHVNGTRHHGRALFALTMLEKSLANLFESPSHACRTDYATA